MNYTDNLDANFGFIFKFLHMAMVGNLVINSEGYFIFYDEVVGIFISRIDLRLCRFHKLKGRYFNGCKYF